jgi:hypothetical protein
MCIAEGRKETSGRRSVSRLPLPPPPVVRRASPSLPFDIDHSWKRGEEEEVNEGMISHGGLMTAQGFFDGAWRSHAVEARQKEREKREKRKEIQSTVTHS